MPAVSTQVTDLLRSHQLTVDDVRRALDTASNDDEEDAYGAIINLVENPGFCGRLFAKDELMPPEEVRWYARFLAKVKKARTAGKPRGGRRG